MDVRIRMGLLVLACTSLAGCAMGSRLGWTSERHSPTAEIQASCESAVKTLEGQPDHSVALDACIDANSRRAVRRQVTDGA